MKNILLIILVTCFSVSLSASEIRGVDKFGTQLSETINQMNESLNGSEIPLMTASSDWLFNMIKFEGRLTAGFSIPGIVGIKVTPYLELTWVKQMPEGVKAYIPAKKI